MTVVFAAVGHEFSVAANDSCVLQDFGEHKEYGTGGKHYVVPGAGVVTMWGGRDGNHLIEHLKARHEALAEQGVDALCSVVDAYLRREFAPHSYGLEDTGYHVSGYRPDGSPRLYHAFYNGAGSPGAFESNGAYSLQDQSPGRGETRLLYNGRNDIAHPLVQLLIKEIKERRQTRFPRTPDGLARFAHFVLRFASELSPDVSPPFFVHLIAASNRIKTISLEPLTPLAPDYFTPAWQQLVANQALSPKGSC